jgi:peptidyl-prolyl cis-trans isomerase SurA
MRVRVPGLLIGVLMTTVSIQASERVLVEGILARVNDRIVTISEFTERVRQELTQMPSQPNNEELREFTDMLLEQMVSEMILMERAEEKRLTVDDQMVDQALANLREENNLQDDEAWEQALASSGLSVEALRERYRRTITVQRAVQGEVRPIEITEQELKQQYELEKEKFRVPAMVELEQVFLTSDEAEAADLNRRAQGLVQRVRDGADLKAEATLAGSELQELGQSRIR